MRQKKTACEIQLGNPREIGHVEDVDENKNLSLSC
jgi:hypothetical protein